MVLCQNLGKRGADVAEHGVDCARQLVDAGDGSQSNEGDEQCVFHQILTILAGHQVLDLHKHLKKKVVHSCSLPGLISLVISVQATLDLLPPAYSMALLSHYGCAARFRPFYEA